MPNLFRNFTYPGTDFHEMNLEWLVAMCQKFVGLALNVSGDKLRLVNEAGEVVSSVTVSYAEKATTDKNGKDISTYIFSVAGVGDTVVFTHGDGTSTAVTVPYASKAKYDINGHELEDYIYNVQIAGDALRITHGDGTIVDLTIPYAVKASTDVDGKDLTTYAASLSVDGDNVVLRDAKGRLLNSITVAYATRALNDGAGDEIEASYGDKLQAGTTTVKLISKDGTQLSEITVPFATEASHATNADHATVATDATNAIESVTVSGDNIVFTTYGGTAYSITSPYSVKAQKDDLGNVIKTTYIANVTNDAQTGELQFRDAMGNIVVSLLPAVDTAKNDTYGNLIADFVKTISVSSNSDYVTVTHGTGNVDTLTIHYAETAWKDTNGNVIKNFYISYLECVEDVLDGHYKIVAYNGDTPRAELFRFEVTAYSAQTDINGKDLTTYVADVDYNASKQIEVTDGGGNTLKTLANELGNVADVNLTTPANGDILTYDSNDDEWVNAPIQLSLDDLTDVTIDSNTLADADVLTYDANSGEWINKPASGGLQPYSGTPFEFGTYDTIDDSWTYSDFTQYTLWSDQDPSWFTFLEPFVDFIPRLESPIDTYRSYRIADRTTVEYIPGSWVAGNMMGMIAWAITSGLNLKSKAYYGIPNSPDKLLLVTIELTAGALTTNTAQIISAGGGSAIPGYVILGEVNSSDTYTAANYNTIKASAGNLNQLVIKQSFENSGYAILQPIGVQIDDAVAGTQIFEPASKVFTDLLDGVYSTSVLVFTILYTKIGAAPQGKQYYVQFVVDGSDLSLQANALTVLTVGPSV